MSEDHPYLHLQVPTDAPFKLKPSPGKGWGAFATRRIGNGALLLREKPLWVIGKQHTEITEQDIRAAFQGLPPRSKQQFLFLRDNAYGKFTDMKSACAENSFQVASEAEMEKGVRAYGLFILLSRFNHSCVPNSIVPVTTTGREAIASYATKDIMPGEEITFCYNTDFQFRTRQDRHKELCFVCECKACQLGTPFHQMSEIRRRFARAILYLSHGVDMDRGQSCFFSPKIIHSTLKNAAETFEIPVSSRFIYNILLVCLVEEEGLLDDVKVKRMIPPVLSTLLLFQTKENVEIAMLAMRQETWLQRFDVAVKLYGKRDKADNDFNARLRRQYGVS
ncbi:hypothetical protein FZEAL_8321 [Fusarium zealandicum]|uniref:SET domain-containing protein n=1 Tax=Fusarium zealandicum TaxID=1053134 RepID=A0A8H4UE12_9HYPO|nr:hypothetical protein FZEAL_8321 [Fusarium zealandicum]